MRRPPFSAQRCSASLSEVKVLPVPHAEIHLPRSCVRKPSWILAMASFWWGRRLWRTALRGSKRTSTSSWRIQSMGDSAMSASPMRCTGTVWFSRARSAWLDQRSVVEMMMRLSNAMLSQALPEAVKKESMSAFCREYLGS